MKVYKEKQYLVFDFEDGSVVKYDFATKKAIGKKGAPVKTFVGSFADIRSEILLSAVQIRIMVISCLTL